MKKILYITVSPRGDRSKSRMIWDYYLSKLSGYEIEVLDLANEKLPFLTNDVISFMYWFKKYEELNNNDKIIVDLQKKLINQIKNVDRILISTPMWNFWEPAVLKAYFDLIIKMNDTFSYVDWVPVPLIKNIKKVDIVWARWADYRWEYKKMDTLEPETKTLIKFITWIYKINTYWIEWVNMYDDNIIEKEFNELKSEIDKDI